MTEYIVEMKHITKRFPGIVANDDVSLQIKKGEIFAILGENGAGKSTLMSMLFGMYEPDEGEIYVRGEKVIIQSPNHAAALNIGMVHQHFKLISNYTAAENIVLGKEPLKKVFSGISILHKRKAHKEVKALAEKYGLDVNPNDIIERMNVSARQRVEILKMLYRDAEILIFDEPTAVLTPQEIIFLLAILENMRKNGKTIILITHKLEEIKKIADRCAIMNHGKLIAVLDVEETDTKTMANLMVGREVELSALKKKAFSPGKAVLQLKHITIFNEQRVQVVNDVSLKVREGEILAIAGVAGNGQVELADAVAGLTSVSSGRILLQGKDITNFSVRQRALEGISYIPEDRQHYGLVLDFTLAENLGLRSFFKAPFCKRGVLNQKAFRENGKRLIEKYDIRCGRGCDTVVRSMSGGNQQKAIIAREIEQDAGLLIFVQPTRGLDIGAIENIHKQMITEREKGKAILLISLELDEIMNCADTIAVIYNGSIQKIAPAGTLTANQVGEFMMGVKGKDEKS